MSRTIKIFTLIVLYFLACGKSCDNRERHEAYNEKTRVKTETDSLRSVFGTDTLSDADLRAYEQTAGMKLSDLFDYLRILTDTNAAGPFREKAREMIRALFISEDQVFLLMDLDKKERYKISVKQLLSGKDFLSVFGTIIYDSIRVEQELEKADDVIYTGKLSCLFIPEESKSANGRKQSPADLMVDFLLTKHIKIFGADTLMIWEVFLGKMEQDAIVSQKP
ncbi:MAG: hypothetical protein Q8M08_13255 [Bacteroidales bacterium]|nr:hypothetical protein [Bacteroidales bacterium]